MNTPSSVGSSDQAVVGPSGQGSTRVTRLKDDAHTQSAGTNTEEGGGLPAQNRPPLDDAPVNAPSDQPPARRSPARRAARAVKVFASTAVKIGLLGGDAEL